MEPTSFFLFTRVTCCYKLPFVLKYVVLIRYNVVASYSDGELS